MDPLNLVLTIIIACIVVVFVLEMISDVLGEIFCVIIAIAVIGGIGYGLYVGVCYPAYLACCRFISEHPGILKAIVSVVVALVLLIILIWICGYIHLLLTTDYTGLIRSCDRDIARAEEALAQARAVERRHRLSNEFEILEPGRHKYGYNPNRFEKEVDRCEDTLNSLKDKKRYYEKQRRKADELGRM